MGLFLIYLNIFLSNRQQRILVEGNFSQFKPVVLGVPQASVLGPVLFILYTADMWNYLGNKLISYADDTTLYAVVASPSECTNVANSLAKIQS